MNYNKLPQTENRWKVVSILLFCILIVIGIIYMKHTSGEQRQLVAPGGADTSSQQIAVPDTTVDPDILPSTSDTVQASQLSDTLLGKDKRNPYEAGYDDGYAVGCDDGAASTEHANYDDTNSFSTSAEKQQYVRGYREGYAKGYDDGRQGKQFNI
ncbi:MAG: hypothetical protein PUI06_01370 [Prevotella sp.]|nr:hypothetical protein [Prevotella sp.]MDY5665801.1 hypothetical protein [Alloprevotella sp.]